MKLVTLLCACLLITTGTWAYSRDCAKGPEYWCRDASTAEDCGAVRHCEQTVWHENETNKKPMTTSETAQMLCNVLVQASTELLADGSMDVDSIKQYLRQDCVKLPHQNNLIQQCEIAVDIYLLDILRHIQSGTEITKICPIIQGHDTSSVFIPKPKPVGLTSNATCVLCEFVVHLLETFATANSSAQELANILENICKEMPSVLRDECKTFIEAYGADIIALLVREFDPEKTCQLIKVCPKPKDVAFLTKPNAHTCGLCDYVSTYLSAGYPIENVCTHFSTNNNIKQQCEILVHLYKPNFCSQLPLCFDDVVLQPIEATINSVECSLCKYVINYVDAVIQTNKSEAAIQAALEKVCSILPAPLKTPCDHFVDKYGPILVQLIEKYGTADKVCNALKVCHNGTQEVTPLEQVISQISTPNSIPCLLCKYVIGYLETATKGNKSAAAIEAALDKVCALLPAPLKDDCTKFVDKYGPIIAILFAKNATAEEICDFIKVCNNGTQEVTPLQPVQQVTSQKPSPNSIPCLLCKYVIGYLETATKGNKSAAAIEAALDKVCALLPAPLKDDCTKFVDKYGPIIAILFAKNATAEQICDFIKVCNNGTQEVTPLQLVQQVTSQKPSPNSIPCLLCKYVIGYLETATKGNKSAAAIEAALDKVCALLPAPLKDDCTKFVDKYGPIIAILFAKNATAEQICDFIKVCNNGTQELSFLQPVQQVISQKPSPNSIPCLLCKYVIGYLETATKGNKSAAAIEAALDKVCALLPAPLKDDCTKFVDKYGPIIAILFAKNATAEQICDFIKVCNNGTQEVTPLQLVQQVTSQKPSPNSIPCLLCKYVIGYLETATKGNKSAAAIEAALDKVCALLPASLKDECTKFVDKYGPIIALLFAKNATAEEICDFIKVCNNGTQEVTPRDLIQSLRIKQSSINSVECSLCKYVVSYVDTVIQNNKSAAAIETALEKVCTILPAALKDKCTQFVNTYGPVLAQLIAKYATPEQVCNALKLCRNGTQEITPLVGGLMQILKNKQSSVKSAECSLCKYVINYVDAVIQTNKSQAAIEAALEKVCSILPAPLKTPCDHFVDTYGPILVQLIEKYGTADQVCSALKVCHNGTQVAEPISHKIVKPIKSVKDGAECTLCKYILSYINVLIQNNATEQEVEKALEVVCSILPTSYHEKCKKFVETYGPILAELISELDDPNVVCEWLSLCPKSTDKFIEIPALKSKQLQSLPCNLCQYLVNYLDAIVQSNSTETRFEEALDKACNILHETKLQSECKLLVHLYGSDLIKFLVEFGDPKAVCQAIGICDK